MTQKSFNIALKKGEIGEAVVKPILEKQGFIVYQPKTDGAHWFDMLAIKGKDRAIALDIKAKARMNKFPATGINQKHYEEYKKFSELHNMPFWIVFVDEMLGSIYGNSLEALDKEVNEGGIIYPFILTPSYGQRIRLWHLSSMITFSTIPEAEQILLKSYNQRSYDYDILV